MRAMVMAAGLGTRLRPLTYEVPKPMVPVANRPVVEHLLRLLARHELREVIANLHWFPDTIQGPLGDGSAFGVELSYEYEPELTGTAGGVRAVRDFLTAEDGPFVVMAGDALTDADLRALARAHSENGGIATLGVARVANVSEYGVIVTGSDGRVQGFQEKPDPAEALSDLVNTMIYAFEPEIFDYFPDAPMVDFALDVFPALLEHDVPFHVHRIDGYWNDVGSVPEYLRGNLDAVTGAVEVDVGGELVDGSEGKVLMGEGVEVGSDVRLDGPLVIGDGARIGDGAQVKESVLLPGTKVPEGGMLVGAIAGTRGRLPGG